MARRRAEIVVCWEIFVKNVVLVVFANSLENFQNAQEWFRSRFA